MKIQHRIWTGVNGIVNNAVKIECVMNFYGQQREAFLRHLITVMKNRWTEFALDHIR